MTVDRDVGHFHMAEEHMARIQVPIGPLLTITIAGITNISMAVLYDTR